MAVCNLPTLLTFLFVLVGSFQEPNGQVIHHTSCEDSQVFNLNDETGRGGLVRTNGYGPNVNCTWIIRGPPEKVIVVRFNWIDLPAYESGCPRDKIHMFSQDMINLFIVCGKWTPTYGYTSGTASFILELTSDDEDTGKGAEFMWRTANFDDVLCNGHEELAGISGVFSSSFNGVQSYVNNASCSWRIIVPQDKVVLLNFTYVYLLCDSEDSVLIYDGWSPEANLLGRLPLCDMQGTFNTTSTGNSMYVVFTSNNKGTFEGFRAEYLAVQPAVGQEVVNPVTMPSISVRCPDGYGGDNCEVELPTFVLPLRVVSLRPTEVHLLAQALAADVAIKYQVEFLKTTENAAGAVILLDRPRRPTVLIKQTGLREDTDYELRVVPFFDINEVKFRGLPSDVVSIRTPKSTFVLPPWVLGLLVGIFGLILLGIFIGLLIYCQLFSRRNRGRDEKTFDNLYVYEDIAVPDNNAHP